MSERHADVAAFFDGRRLTLARQLAGLRKNALATRIGKSATAVASYEAGTKKPAPATVAELALALEVEPAFFLAAQDGSLTASTAVHFRSLRATSQAARDQAEAYGHLAVETMNTIERHVEFPARDVPGYPVSIEDTDSDAAEEAATRLRKEWEIPSGPLGHLIRLVENHGILVVFSPLDSATVDAYSFDTPTRPVIMLNPLKDDYYRQRFDVAHELGH